MNDYNLRLCVVMAIIRSRRALTTDLQSIPLAQFVTVLGYIHSDLDVELAKHLGSIRPQTLVDTTLGQDAVPVERIMKLVDHFLKHRAKERR